MSYLTTEQINKILSMVLTRESGVDLIDYLEKLEKFSYKNLSGNPESGTENLPTLREIFYKAGIRQGHPIFFLFNDVMNYELDVPIQTELLRTLILEISDLVKDASVLHIDLSFEPSNESTHTLYAWFKGSIQKPFLLDLSVDPEMLGGVKCVFDGKYHDMSLDKKLDELFVKFQFS